ncbi:MAG TPA: acyl-CoA dehydrogenase family protein [Eoetvoesiella sp.]
MNFELTTEQRQLQEAAIRLSQKKLMPILAAHPKDVSLSKSVMLEIFQILAEFGLTGARVPEELGGSGLSMLDYGLVFEQLPPVIALALIAHDGTTSRLCASGAAQGFPILIKDLLAGRKIACTASTEPTTGSDPRSIKLRIRESEDGKTAFLSGTKQWITNGTIADVAFITGKLEGNGELQRYLVEQAVSPFKATEIPCIGLQQGHLSELMFDQVPVPLSNAIGNDNSTMKTLTQAWLVNRPLLGLLGLRTAERAKEAALEHVKDRIQFSSVLASKQLMQEALVDIEASIQSARLLCYSALDAADRGVATQALSAMAKRQGVATAENAASIAMRLYGAMGLAIETGVEQHSRDIKMLTIPDGTYEILTLIAGRQITSQSAF